MDVADDLRPRQVQQVGVAGHVARVVGEALAAVRLLPAHLALDEDAPRPVEHGDPPLEDLAESVAYVAHVGLLPRECVSGPLAGSLGVC